MAYTIYKTNGTFLTTIADGTINRGSTSVALPGRNYSGYGLYIDQDLVQMLENFAGNTVPPNPIAGQLWYDTSVPGGALRVCPADGTLNPADWQEVATGGSGANVNFGNISIDNLTANSGSFIDISAANTIRANSSILVGNPELIALYGANGHIQAVTANIGNITTSGINGPSNSQITTNSQWLFNQPVTFAGAGNSVTITGNLITNGGVTIGGATTLANVGITTLRIPNNPASTSGTLVIDNSNVTIGNGSGTTTVNASGANVTLGTTGNSTGTIGNVFISGSASAGNVLGTTTAADNGNKIVLVKTGATDTSPLQWRYLSTESIANGTSRVTIGATAFTTIVNGSTILTANTSAVTVNGSLTATGTASIGGSLTLSGGSGTSITASTIGAISAPAANVQFLRLGVGLAPGGSNGEIRATNDITAYYSSDARLKTNVRPIENALEDLKKIRGVRYDWTDEYIELKGGEDDKFVRRSDVGVIAQEIEEILPEIVATNSEGYKAVKYERIVSILIEAVKELAEQVATLKSQQ